MRAVPEYTKSERGLGDSLIVMQISGRESVEVVVATREIGRRRVPVRCEQGRGGHAGIEGMLECCSQSPTPAHEQRVVIDYQKVSSTGMPIKKHALLCSYGGESANCVEKREEKREERRVLVSFTPGLPSLGVVLVSTGPSLAAVATMPRCPA